MYEKSKAGIETHYVSLEVFKALVICTDYDKTKEQFLSMASLIKEKTNYLINSLNEKINLKCEYEFDLSLSKMNRKDLLKILRRKVITTILSVSLLSGGSYEVSKALKNSQDYYINKYLTTTSVVTLEDGFVKNKEEYLELLENRYQVILEESNVIHNGFFYDSVVTNLYDVIYLFPEGTKEFPFSDFSFLEFLDKLDSVVNKEFFRS